MGAMFDILQERFELRPAMIFQFEPFFDAAPRLIRSDVAAFGVALRRSAAEIGEISEWRGAFFGRLYPLVLSTGADILDLSTGAEIIVSSMRSEQLSCEHLQMLDNRTER